MSPSQEEFSPFGDNGSHYGLLESQKLRNGLVTLSTLIHVRPFSLIHNYQAWVSLFRQYYFVNESKTWLEAQSYCRENYTDLATVDKMEEMKQLMEAVDPTYVGDLWIGLNKAPLRRWGWSSGESPQYMNWRFSEPNDRDGLCAAKYQFSGWIDAQCTDVLEFVCYSGELRYLNYNK
uniref:C-type lectin domain-containing protein n=1 Tax=Pygocentrus nattereri TaxID=42514 RepID=A0A3B4E0H1_PYGNA